MSNQPSTPPPLLFIFNVSKTGTRHICDSPHPSSPYIFLASFASALQSARKHDCVVQGAIYGPGGASIFIDTEDEHWEEKVGIDVPQDVQRKLDGKVAARVEGVAAVDQPSAASSVNQTPESVSIFKVGNAPHQHIQVVQQENDDDEPQSLLKAFVEAIYSLIDKDEVVQGAMYGAQEGAKIFISGN